MIAIITRVAYNTESVYIKMRWVRPHGVMVVLETVRFVRLWRVGHVCATYVRLSLWILARVETVSASDRSRANPYRKCIRYQSDEIRPMREPFLYPYVVCFRAHRNERASALSRRVPDSIRDTLPARPGPVYRNISTPSAASARWRGCTLRIEVRPERRRRPVHPAPRRRGPTG